MSLFFQKSKVSLDKFCQEFYDNTILNQVAENVDINSVLPEYVKKKIADADDVFANIDLQKFTDEIVILRFELFALSWLHKFGDRLAVAQSIFTKEYLHDKKRDDIWDAMEHYNQAIAHSFTATPFIIRMRMDLYDDYCKKGYDSKCVARVLNRMFSEKAWENMNIGYFLILALCHRFSLGSGSNYLGPNEKAQLELQVFIRGLYDGAKQSWEKVKIIR